MLDLGAPRMLAGVRFRWGNPAARPQQVRVELGETRDLAGPGRAAVDLFMLSVLLNVLVACSGRASNVHRLFCLAATAAQTRPVPNVALSSLHNVVIKCFLGCLGQLIPLPCRWLVTNHAAHCSLVGAHEL